jgi:hypothetical protein
MNNPRNIVIAIEDAGAYIDTWVRTVKSSSAASSGIGWTI